MILIGLAALLAAAAAVSLALLLLGLGLAEQSSRCHLS
jgi:hypothetical protein